MHPLTPSLPLPQHLTAALPTSTPRPASYWLGPLQLTLGIDWVGAGVVAGSGAGGADVVAGSGASRCR